MKIGHKMGRKFFAGIVGCTLIIYLSISTFSLIDVAAEEYGSMFYKQKIEPITNRECARCHFAVFTDIRDKGGAHQMVCMECHETFHIRKPGKKWKDIVPDCIDCHSLSHGTNFSDCIQCHENAHAPVDSLKFVKLVLDCDTCHINQATEISQSLGAHTDTACSSCHHDTHGYIPACVECHLETHTPFTKNDGCNACHPSHSPLKINFNEDVADAICTDCHTDAGKKLSSSDNGHSFLKCANCHADKHRYIPICQECHGKEPHSKELLEKFGDCKNCHGDSHTLTIQEQ